MKAVAVGTTSVLECTRCEGLWVDIDSLQQICAEREKQASVMGMPAHPDAPLQLEKQIRYVPCPVCHQLMNRVNFAHCSHVIVDVCKSHGTWFDKDELRRTVEFIRAGGLENPAPSNSTNSKKNSATSRRPPIDNANIDSGLALSGLTSEAPRNSISTTVDMLLDLLR